MPLFKAVKKGKKKGIKLDFKDIAVVEDSLILASNFSQEVTSCLHLSLGMRVLHLRMYLMFYVIVRSGSVMAKRRCTSRARLFVLS